MQKISTSSSFTTRKKSRAIYVRVFLEKQLKNVRSVPWRNNIDSSCYNTIRQLFSLEVKNELSCSMRIENVNHWILSFQKYVVVFNNQSRINGNVIFVDLKVQQFMLTLAHPSSLPARVKLEGWLFWAQYFYHFFQHDYKKNIKYYFSFRNITSIPHLSSSENVSRVSNHSLNLWSGSMV